MSPAILDIIVITVVLISAILAMIRGFVREVLAIASWAIAALAAYLLYDAVLPLVRPYFESTTVSTVISAAAVFFITLILASYLTMKIADFVIDSRVGAIDRALGFLFGAARGILLLVIALQFFNWLVPNSPTWVEDARTRPFLEDLGEQLVSALPEDVEANLLERLRGGSTAPAAPGNEAEGAQPSYENSDRGNLDQLIQGTDQ